MWENSHTGLLRVRQTDRTLVIVGRRKARVAALGDAVATLSKSAADIYLSDRAYWRNVSTATWSYKLGGYPWLGAPGDPSEQVKWRMVTYRAQG